MSFDLNSNLLGPLLIALAALAWASDSLFRLPAVNSLNPVLIVFFEHVLILAALTPLFLLRRRSYLAMTAKGWLTSGFIGAGGSALASLYFSL
jgi:drug/metabolite transporter, DME family